MMAFRHHHQMSRYHICYLRPPLWPFNTSDDFLIPLSSSFMALFRFSSCLSNRCYPYRFIISTTVFSKFLSFVLISSFPIFSFGCNWDFLAEDSKSVSRLALLSKHHIISEKSKTQFNPLPFSTFPPRKFSLFSSFPHRCNFFLLQAYNLRIIASVPNFSHT